MIFQNQETDNKCRVEMNSKEIRKVYYDPLLLSQVRTKLI